MNAPALRVGRCPSVFRPMMSGDGLIVRVKPRAGVLTLEQAEAIGALAQTCGNGLIDVTARANLQLRGVRPNALEHMSDVLVARGLAAADPDGEAIRNIVASPLAGLDPSAKLDIRPLVEALDDLLATERSLCGLHPKWSVVVDDGGALPLIDIPSDVRFEVAEDGAVLVGLADDPTRGQTTIADANSAIALLARLTLTSANPRRMVDLVREQGAAAIFLSIGLQPTDGLPLSHGPKPEDLLGSHALTFSRANGRRWPSRQRGSDEGNLKLRSQREISADLAVFGVAAPFGSLSLDQWRALVAAARAAGAADLRLTPWRVILATSILSSQTTAFGAAVSAAGLIVHADDPRLSVSACIGAPACLRTAASTRSDAQQLIAALGAGLTADRPRVEEAEVAISKHRPRTGMSGQSLSTFASLTRGRMTQRPIHISGCLKGCGAPRSSAWTLVARVDAYDLIRSGSVGDAPAAVGLSLPQAAAWIGRQGGGSSP